jgi:hypothetical protein
MSFNHETGINLPCGAARAWRNVHLGSDIAATRKEKLMTYMETLKSIQNYRDPKSFAAFLDSDDGRKHCTLELHQRLTPVATSVTTLNLLLKFVKERFPSHYSPDWRVVTGAPYSREAMKELWAAYLAWREQGSTP